MNQDSQKDCRDPVTVLGRSDTMAVDNSGRQTAGDDDSLTMMMSEVGSIELIDKDIYQRNVSLIHRVFEKRTDGKRNFGD